MTKVGNTARNPIRVLYYLQYHRWALQDLSSFLRGYRFEKVEALYRTLIYWLLKYYP